MLNLDYLKDYFDMKKTWYAGVDGAICKAELTAMRPGTITKDFLGLNIKVRHQSEESVNEVKRMGYMRDREADL